MHPQVFFMFLKLHVFYLSIFLLVYIFRKKSLSGYVNHFLKIYDNFEYGKYVLKYKGNISYRRRNSAFLLYINKNVLLLHVKLHITLKTYNTYQHNKSMNITSVEWNFSIFTDAEVPHLFVYLIIYIRMYCPIIQIYHYKQYNYA